MAVDRYYYMERETGNILELEEIAVAIYGSRAEADRLAIPVYMAEDVEHLLPRSTEETTANCGKRFALGIPCNQVAGHEGGCSWSDRAVNTKTEQSKP
jgi:hypothetical protein